MTPHVAQNLGRRGGSAVDRARHGTRAMRSSQKKRKRIEECFGWLKTVRCCAKYGIAGTLKVGWIFARSPVRLTILVRMRNLMHSVVPT